MHTQHKHSLKWFCIAAVGLMGLLLGCKFNPQGEVTKYDPDKAYKGYTLHSIYSLASPPSLKYLNVIDMQGNIVWSILDTTSPGNYWNDAELMPNGHILTSGAPGPVLEIDPATNKAVWQYPAANAIQEVSLLPDGNIIFLTQDLVDAPDYSPRCADRIQIVNPSTNAVVWEWKVEDHIPFNQYCPLCITQKGIGCEGADWTHANAVSYRKEAAGEAIYINFRNLNRICKIEYPSGTVLWSLGDGGDFGQGLFSHAHDPEFLSNGNILLFDDGKHRNGDPNPGYSRAIEIAFDPAKKDARIVWEYNPTPSFYCDVMGDADRLPNGNTLITDATNGRIVEVTPEKETVWEYQLPPLEWIYRSQRIETWPIQQATDVK